LIVERMFRSICADSSVVTLTLALAWKSAATLQTNSALIASKTEVQRNPRLRDVSQELYLGGRREMLNEVNRGEVREHLLSWITAGLGRDRRSHVEVAAPQAALLGGF
jgi:hypothetical protein